jgi:hypothetical protein
MLDKSVRHAKGYGISRYGGMRRIISKINLIRHVASDSTSTVYVLSAAHTALATIV